MLNPRKLKVPPVNTESQLTRDLSLLRAEVFAYCVERPVCMQNLMNSTVHRLKEQDCGKSHVGRLRVCSAHEHLSQKAQGALQINSCSKVKCDACLISVHEHPWSKAQRADPG